MTDINIPSDRRNQIYQLHREAYRDQFSQDPSFIDAGSEESRIICSREILWHSLPFLAGNEFDIGLANTMIRAMPKLNNHLNPNIPLANQDLTCSKADNAADDTSGQFG